MHFDTDQRKAIARSIASKKARDKHRQAYAGIDHMFQTAKKIGDGMNLLERQWAQSPIDCLVASGAN